MVGETMSRWERVMATVSMEKPDRVPVVPQLCKTAALTLQGLTQGQGNLDIDLAMGAMLATFDDYGGWDALYLDVPDTAAFQTLFWKQPLRFLVPGKDLPGDQVMQALEEEVLQIEEYDRIAQEGWDKFYYDEYVYRITDYAPGQVPQVMADLEAWAGEALKGWEERGVQSLYGSADPHPFFKLSLARSLIKFTEDLYYRPEMVERALKPMVEETIKMLLDGCKQTGINITLLVEERAAAYYYPLHVFERFWWPYTVQIVDALFSEGIVTAMHLDTDWTKNLPYFKQLPKGSYILQLDSMTDIFAAKEVLAGQAIFHGDLPPAMQAIGAPQEVEAYCKRLIDEVGYDGGLILGVGCEVASDCKPENFRTLIETGKNYEFSKG